METREKEREEGKEIGTKPISRRQLIIAGAGVVATGLLTTVGLAGCGTAGHGFVGY